MEQQNFQVFKTFMVLSVIFRRINNEFLVESSSENKTDTFFVKNNFSENVNDLCSPPPCIKDAICVIQGIFLDYSRYMLMDDCVVKGWLVGSIKNLSSIN